MYNSKMYCTMLYRTTPVAVQGWEYIIMFAIVILLYRLNNDKISTAAAATGDSDQGAGTR